MKTIYESRKRVTRELEGSTHTLPILFEYAWSMPGVCLEYAYSMPRVCLAYAYTHLIRKPYAISVRARRTASPLLTDQESAPYGLFLTLLLLFSGVVGSWADDYEGFWYINNQRLPNDGYYFVPTINCFYDSDEDQPHLTTFKTGKDKNSIWRIESVTVGTDTYYRIIHNATGKYLMANSAVPELASVSAAHRKRVHLETLSSQDLENLDSDRSTDKSLFYLKVIDANNKIIAIKPKNVGSTTTGDGSTHVYINPRGNGGDEFDSYRAKDGREITHVNGIVGFWGNDSKDQPSTDKQPGSCWKLETATSTCANPVIKYIDSDTKIQISYPIGSDTDWTIYYTTDGSDPSDATNSNRTEITATATLTDLTGVSKVRAIATKSGWDSSEESVLIASGKTQLVQSKDCEAFYMVPPIAEGETNVTTTNIPNARMGWNFVPAGLYCGIQYYNIINAETGQYLYCNVNNGQDNAIIMKSSSDIISDTYNQTIDRAKFRLIVQADGSYKVISKWWAAENPNAYYVNKKNGNNGGNALNLADGSRNTALWNVIAAPSSPKTQFDASFASSSSSAHFYEIQNATDDHTYHIIPPTTSGGKATANTTGANPAWFFLPVDDNDTWIPYYHIRNGKTGEYLYYNSGSFYTSLAVESDNEDRYMFVVVKSAYTTDPTHYNVIPKALKDQAKQENNSLNRNGTTLRILDSRNKAESNWKLEEVALFCNDPVFTETDGAISISCIPDITRIYYTTDGANPTPNNEDQRYTSTITLSASDQLHIKAIAVLDDGTTTISSNVITLLNNPKITLATDSYTYDGTAKQPAVSEVSIGETPNKTTATAGTDYETVIATDYSNNTNAGTAKVTLRDKASNVYVWHAEKEFTINKKDLTATADNKTISYGDDVPTYTISYTGFENSEDASAVTTPPTITCAYTSTSDVNTYPISVNTDGVATNYNIIPGTPGTLTVNQREVVLSWGTTPIIYNGTAQAPTVTATNLVNEDVVGVTVDGAQTGAGDYTATASALTGDKAGNYKLPTANTQDFTIGKRPVTVSGITASDKEYDGTTTATLVLTGTAFAEGDIIGTDNVTIESATGAFADANAGTGKTVTISAITLGGTSVSNYEFAGSSQQTEITANITKAPLTVTADNQNITYGDAAPTYTITYAGWKNGEEKTVLTTEPTASSEYTQGSNAGSYPIIVTGGIATNYDITPQNGTLTVGPKTLTQDNISFGEGGIVVVKDGETILTEGTDYTIGEEQHSGINNKYTVTPVIGKNDGTSSGTGNYTGTVSIRHANVHLTTGANQANYSATFVAESAGDADIGHVLPEGFTAYIISGIEGSWAIPEPMEYIPAGVPVLLVAHEEKTGFLVRDAKSADVSDISAQKSYNKLKEVTAESAHFNTRQIYVLYKNEFVLNKAGYLAKGKVYIENPKYVAPSSPSSPAPASLSIAWGNITGIEDGRWKMDDGRSERWYTLDGRCLIGKPSAKGLYIVNGKKRVVK